MRRPSAPPTATGPTASRSAPAGRRRLALAAAVALVALALTAVAAPSAVEAATSLAGMAYVTNYGSNSVTPINTVTDVAGPPIFVGTEPDAIAISPNGEEAYVANFGSNSVTPIDLATSTAGTAIAVGLRPDAIAIAPDGTTAYVADFDGGEVTPIDLATNKAESPIATGPAGKELHPDAVIADPSNDAVYVASATSANLVEIDPFDAKAELDVAADADPVAAAVSAESSTAYVANFSASTLTPVDLATDHAASAISLGDGSLPRGVAVTPNGAAAFVSDFGTGAVTEVSLASGRASAPISVGTSPMGIVASPDGSTVYVADSGSNEVTPIDVATGAAGAAIAVGRAPDAIAVVPGWTAESIVSWTCCAATTADAPAVAEFDGHLYAAWVDAVSDDEVLWSVEDASGWTEASQLATSTGDALSLAAPSLAVAEGKLWAVWKGNGDGVHGVWASSFDGSSWSAQHEVSWGTNDDATTDNAPSVAEYGTLPVVAWTDASGVIDVSIGTSSGGWDKPATVKGTSGDISTAHRPALAYSPLNDLLIVGWTTNADAIQYLAFDPVSGTSSAEATVPSAATAQGPAFSSTGEALYVAWEGRTNNEIGYAASWPEDTSFGDWTAQEFEPQASTDETPSLTADGYDVIAAWAGLGTDSLEVASSVTPY